MTDKAMNATDNKSVIDNLNEKIEAETIDVEVVDDVEALEETTILFLVTKNGLMEYEDPNNWASDITVILDAIKDADTLNKFIELNGDHLDNAHEDWPDLVDMLQSKIQAKITNT